MQNTVPNNNPDNSPVTTPWYKQFWPWVLIFLPTAAVVASVTTLMIAIENKPDLVAEDYYKKGKAINQDLTRIKKAFSLALKYEIDTSQEQQLVLRQTFGTPQNAAVRLNFIHPTITARDFSQLLTASTQGVYRMDLEQPLKGKWTIQVESFDGSWRIQDVAMFPVTTPVVLNALPN